MKARDITLAVLVATLWGLNFVVIHVALDSFPPLLLTALRYLVAAFPAVLLIGRPQAAWRWVLVVGVLNGALQFGLLFTAIRLGMPAGLASLLLPSLAMLFTALFAAGLLGERLGARQRTGMALALTGIALVATGYGQASPLLALALTVASAACWALGNIATRKAAPPDAFRFIAWTSVVPPLPLFALSAAVEGTASWQEAFSRLSPTAVGTVVYLGWVATILGFGIWAGLLRRNDAGAVVPYALLVPVVGMSAAALLLGERLSVLRVVAAAVVIAGVAVLSRPGRRRPPTPNAAEHRDEQREPRRSASDRAS
ncbi:EamA family transporter [Streptomyces sp. NPDC059002]|uniref:EamA family transporter n=1 Tax=Streptomyces sp. NPDC059002 TaxID=3346690 RepID=UPI003688860D